MSTREAILDEIKTAPGLLVRATYDFILFLEQRRALEAGTGEPEPVAAKPDFLARHEALFGNRILADSQSILDELRTDRF